MIDSAIGPSGRLSKNIDEASNKTIESHASNRLPLMTWVRMLCHFSSNTIIFRLYWFPSEKKIQKSIYFKIYRMQGMTIDRCESTKHEYNLLFGGSGENAPIYAKFIGFEIFNFFFWPNDTFFTICSFWWLWGRRKRKFIHKFRLTYSVCVQWYSDCFFCN